MSPVLIRFLIYGCLGWCGEIIFTAVTDRLSGRAKNWLLMGVTSLWYFPMYGSIVFLYEPLHDFLRPQFFLIRAVAYLLGFWAIEYAGGWLIWKLTGHKPWDYTHSPGGSLHGLIRWNFVLVWPLYGLALEPVHDFLVQVTLMLLQAMRG
jgi:uncharacterized membrane protein